MVVPRGTGREAWWAVLVILVCGTAILVVVPAHAPRRVGTGQPESAGSSASPPCCTQGSAHEHATSAAQPQPRPRQQHGHGHGHSSSSSSTATATTMEHQEHRHKENSFLKENRVVFPNGASPSTMPRGVPPPAMFTSLSIVSKPTRGPPQHNLLIIVVVVDGPPGLGAVAAGQQPVQPVLPPPPHLRARTQPRVVRRRPRVAPAGAPKIPGCT